MDNNERVQPSYRVLIDGRWSLYDLYALPHALSQTYFFIYCFDSQLPTEDRARIDKALTRYPWRGGFSYLNIYSVFESQIPEQDRPRVKSLSYGSPGWMDIFLNVDVAMQVAKSVGILLAAGMTAAEVYKKIFKTYSAIRAEKEKAKLSQMKFSQAQLKILLAMCEDLAKFLGFESVSELNKRTGNEEVTLKLLLAHYRRMNTLVEFVQEGKAKLPERSDRSIRS